MMLLYFAGASAGIFLVAAAAKSMCACVCACTVVDGDGLELVGLVVAALDVAVLRTDAGEC